MKSRLTWLCVFLFSAVASPLFASGISLHLWMAEKAVDAVALPDLQQLVSEKEAAALNGSIFPDSGYIIGHAYGEHAHWSGFLNAYYQSFRNRCPDLGSDECRALFAHFLGAVSHVVADINFDRHFIGEAARQDFGGNVDEAQKNIDTGADFLAIMDYDRAFQLPEYSLPSDAILEAFSIAGEVQATSGDLLKGTNLLRLGLVGEPFGAPFAYLFYKNKMPWAAANYALARGGVDDTALRIARAWELVYLAYLRGNVGPLFRNEGRWPNADFYVDGRYLEDSFR